MRPYEEEDLMTRQEEMPYEDLGETGEWTRVHEEASSEIDEGISQPLAKRSKYSAKMDRFLNSAIIITGILLLAVILIAFLV